MRHPPFDLDALAALGRRLEDTTTPASVGSVLVEAVTAALPFRRAAFVSLSGGGPLVLAEAPAPAPDTPPPPSPGTAPAGAVAAAAAGRRTCAVDRLDAEIDAWLAAALPGASDLVLVPLWAGGRCAAVLVAEPARPARGRRDPATSGALEALAAVAAQALRHSLLLETVEQAAVSDALTGLPNRRSFADVINREVARALRRGEELSLILVDIDQIDTINERFGPDAGDEVIRQVARALSGRLRRFDTAARFGGQEFAVVLPSCGTAEALRISEEIRRRVSALELVARVTVSTGIATLPTHGIDAVDLLSAAGGALNHSKRAGRDQSTAVGVFPD